MVRLGKIVGVHALGGEVRFLPYNPHSDTLAPGVTAVLCRAGEAETAEVASVRRHQRFLLVRFAGVDDRSAAERLRGCDVWVRLESLPAPGPNEFYYHELEGMEVVTGAGESLGYVARVMTSAGADLLVVRQGEREYLIPMVAEFVKSIDRNLRRVCIEPIPGLLEP